MDDLPHSSTVPTEAELAKQAEAGGGPPAEAVLPTETRHRLLHAGLQLFAAQGFATTSTRELAEAAQVNVAAISYHFGDKAGLYRAVFFEPMGCSARDDAERFADPRLSLTQALRGFYDSFLEPLKQGDVVRLCMKLHFREMLEPTGLWEEELAHGIQPMHVALVEMLRRHLGLQQADDDLQRLAVSLVSLGVHLHVGRDVIDEVAPGLMQGDTALDHWSDRLLMFGLAMVQAEAARRGLGISASALLP
jgi:TetR/AcrR family transcriptional regulator, regulator of cefoperazone and chloramphenicol sensitivity